MLNQAVWFSRAAFLLVKKNPVRDRIRVLKKRQRNKVFFRVGLEEEKARP